MNKISMTFLSICCYCLSLTAMAQELSQSCSFIYGVHDGGRNNSQFFRYSNETGFEALGPVYRGYDIEGLDISSDQVLYATSGDDTDKQGYLYTVNMNTGEILTARPIGCGNEVDGISVNPVTGDLWGWSQDKGLIRITETACTVQVPNPTGFEVEDLSWNNVGNTIYFPYNAHAGGLEENDANATHHIGKYEVNGDIDWNLCDIQAPEIEAIEELQDGSLLIGFHENGQQLAMRFDPISCNISTKEVTTEKYTDIEGIAVCPPTDKTFRAIADCAPTRGTTPLIVKFRSRGDFSGGSIVRYRWDFEGDGRFDRSDAVARDYDFTFRQQGTYNSILEVTNNLNETVTDSCTIVVLGNHPTARVTAAPSNGPAPLLVNLTCIGTDTDGTIALYEWDFDGDGVFDFNSPTSGNITHTYTIPGTFNALCRVTDNQGLTGTASTINSVVRLGPPGSPTVTATASPTKGKAPLPVNFGGSATDDGNIVKWEWDFEGDGTFDFSSPSSPYTRFTYTSPGTFAAMLRVTDDDGLTSMDNIEIVVGVNATLSIANDTFDPTINGTVTIDTSISADMPVRLLIKDKNGRVIRTLVNNTRTAGNYSDPWDGRDDAGQMLSEGDYYAILEYDVDGKTFSVDLTNTTGGSRHNPPRSSIPRDFSPLAGKPLIINFTLHRASEVTAFIGRYNVDTRLLTFMERLPLGKGTHQVIWNGENADGQLIHPPPGDRFLFGIWGYTLPDNAIYLHSGAHISNFSVAPSIFDPTGYIDDQGTPEQSQLTFDLSNPADVELVVSNAETGKKVAQRRFTGLSAGTNTVSWNGRDDNGLIVASGRYRLGVVAVDGTGFLSLRIYALQRVYY